MGSAPARAFDGRSSRTATWTPSAVVTRSSVRWTGEARRAAPARGVHRPGVSPEDWRRQWPVHTERAYRAGTGGSARGEARRPGQTLQCSSGSGNGSGRCRPRRASCSRCCGPVWPPWTDSSPEAASRWVRWSSSGESRPRAGPGSPSAPSPRHTGRCGSPPGWTDRARSIRRRCPRWGSGWSSSSSCGLPSRGSWRGARSSCSAAAPSPRWGSISTHTGVRLSPPESRRLVEAASRSGGLLLLLTPAEAPADGTLRLQVLRQRPARDCASRWCAAARAPRRARWRCRGSCSRPGGPSDVGAGTRGLDAPPVPMPPSMPFRRVRACDLRNGLVGIHGQRPGRDLPLPSFAQALGVAP